MNKSLEIPPVSGPVRASIRPPGSKSITNRALVCAALADGVSTLRGALDSEDTRVMIAALGQLGIEVATSDDNTTLVVHGTGGEVPTAKAELFCANSGTTIRFLTALVALGHGTFRLDGVARMRERPIGDLLSSLRDLGVDLHCEGANDCPPVVVFANGLAGGTTSMRGDVSSQYLSGLLMAAPEAKTSLTVRIKGQLVSQPYVRMTLAAMESFGVNVKHDDARQQFVIEPQQYCACDYSIEPDASAASYFWAMAAITGGEVTVKGLSTNSLQGDVAFVDALEQMGCEVRRGDDSITVLGKPLRDNALRGIEIDMNAISDTVQTLAVVALFAEGPTTIRGVEHIKHKETDRIGNLAIELRKLGATVDEHSDGLTIHPRPLHGAAIDTYDDHRMAMSLSLAGLRIPGVVINDPGCTAKTYPQFFEDLQHVTES